ncbi:hypothetical protein MKEN_00361800 [Mycena kentingensis (nom. inval.)]|nr:hypothetical protein MKEN_00361800 [Mycena kentingensis (nom. inval.)]
MKLTLSTVFLSMLISSSFAAPLTARHRGNRGKKMMSQSTASGVGAAYFLTNEPTGNFVVAASIGNDGKLTLRQATPADGAGAHGLGEPNAAPGPDPLFTQGAVKASAASNLLATVNAGSNTLSVFNIDPQNPTNLDMLGQPIGSGGEFPVSVAFNKAGDSVCALNAGVVNGVACFKVDKTAGTIAPIAGSVRSLNLNQTTPATGPAGTPSHVVFSEDNTKLIASVKGIPPTPGFFAVWDVDATTGALSEDFQASQPTAGGLLPFSMTIIPGKNAILATDAGLGLDIFDLDAAAQDGVAAGRSTTLAIDGQSATCWSSFSKKTGNFYLTDIGTSLVSEIQLDDNLKPALVKQYPQGDGVATIDNDIVSVGDNDFMFVLAANATQVKVLALNSPGQASDLQTLDIAGPAKAAGLAINGVNLQGMTTFLKQ